MGLNYIAVQWNRQKKLYDAVLVVGVAAYLVIFSVLDQVDVFRASRMKSC